MENIDLVRAQVVALYPRSERWAKRVKKMSNDQVYATFMSKIEKGITPGETRKEKDDEFPF